MSTFSFLESAPFAFDLVCGDSSVFFRFEGIFILKMFFRFFPGDDSEGIFSSGFSFSQNIRGYCGKILQSHAEVRVNVQGWVSYPLENLIQWRSLAQRSNAAKLALVLVVAKTIAHT